ncbi:unnamed protein product [Parnassius apollo]|uniref:(apollo) hypothetical protein n=1 Tax=Parnassius apollo TaxID=110799 RepID=A0A8S3XH02_PARAO|nr:unnamed protein product [Parnassius apollo]
MLTLIADKKIKRNFCHGILLQVIKLLDNKPDNLTLEEDAIERLRSHIKSTQWILELAVDELPCYLLMDEYWKMVNLLIWRFSSLIDQNIIENVIEYLNILLTQDKYVAIVPGRDICLANATSLYFIILNKYGNNDEIQKLIYTTLPHKIYEVVLATLNYLLILYNELDIEDKFQEHLSLLRNQNILETLKKDPKYTSELSQALKSAKYSECKQKCLKVLSLEDDTQKYIIEANLNNREVTDEVIFSELIHLVENEHEKFTHIYLYSLTSFLIKKLRESDANQKCILEAVRVIFACSSSDNSDSTRGVVVSFLERHFKILINKEFHDLTEEEKFEMKATLLATLVSLLEDDEESLRQRCGGVVTDVTSPTLGPAVGSMCAELVLAHVCGSSPGPQLLAALALLDFRCQVCLSDQSDDECRVFDQNEKYNVFLEETIWTVACADHIKQIYKGSNICERILEMLNDPLYKQTFDKLCGSNVESFRNVLNGLESNVINPKVDLFVRELRR